MLAPPEAELGEVVDIVHGMPEYAPYAGFPGHADDGLLLFAFAVGLAVGFALGGIIA